MKLVINDIERECTILPAPKGVFCVDEGILVFPQYIVIAQTVGEEKRYGSTLMCPIDHNNDGYIKIMPITLYDELNLYNFKRSIGEYIAFGYSDSDIDAAEYIYDSMCIHKVPIRSNVPEYINELRNQEYAKQHPN